jgi:hypothetical protein
MAADLVRQATGRPATDPRVVVPRAEIVRPWAIARRAESARDSGDARAIRLPVTGSAHRGLGPAASVRRARRVPGQAAHHARAATAATINGVARVGLGPCAGGVDGTSQWWLKRALPQAPRLRHHNLKPPRLSSRPKAKRSSSAPSALPDLDSGLAVRVPA